MSILILNAKIVNEGRAFHHDVLIKGERIEKIAADLQSHKANKVIDASGQLLLPGVIDDQVHFREPGLTHKASIATESKAALAGGVTSYMEMPNTVPPVFTQELLQQKYEIAARSSFANYSFYMGTSNDNFDEVMRTDLKHVCGLKIFMGSSTGNLLVDNPTTLERLFGNFPGLIATHCEDEATIQFNNTQAKERYGNKAHAKIHPHIRSIDACYKSSSFAVALAKRLGTRLHVLHISTARETELFESKQDLKDKKITAEACIHHLWFTDADYERLGNFIKWNPAIKSKTDQDAIWAALNSGKIDVIATDHAPHTLEEKETDYFSAPAGGPLIQHGLLAMLECSLRKRITLEQVVQKMSHNPALLYQIKERGFIREGYYADLVVVDQGNQHSVSEKNILAKCGWSPFQGQMFSNSIRGTILNGQLGYWDNQVNHGFAQRLEFSRF